MSAPAGMTEVAVVGGGAAGLAAAISASRAGARVVLLEKNEKLGKKLYITGKGRCNVTNACPRGEFFENVVRNPKFLYSSLSAFDSAALAELLEASGCPLKTERGMRVFPVSDKASDVTRALVRNLSGVSIRLREEVLGIERGPDGLRVLLPEGVLGADAVVLATGGASYPATGSTGDGYRFAKSAGHTVTPLRPALVGIRLEESVRELAGLSLKNVRVSVRTASGRTFSEFGEMLFTHTGVSGPAVLTLSSKINREKLAGAELRIDCKPALSEEELDRRLLREFSGGANRHFKTVLGTLLPRSLIPRFIEKCGVEGDREANSIRQAERKSILRTLKALSFPIRGLCGIAGGVVTSGGVDVSEVDPGSMESRILPGLYFAGELLDVDALTGGFNLQIAFSTGWLAGRSAAERALGRRSENNG